MDLFSSLNVISLIFFVLASVAALTGILGRNPLTKKISLVFSGIAFLSLSGVIFLSFQSNLPTDRGLYVLFLCWILVFVSFIAYFWIKLDILALFSSPIALFTLLFSSLSSGEVSPLVQDFSGPFFKFHLFSIFFGIGFMALAACAAILFIWQENSLKRKTQFNGFRKDLPSLTSLDKINAISTFIGFPTYALGLLCGFLWGKFSWGTFFTADPKEIVSLIILALYGYLFHLRAGQGRKGRKPAIIAIAVFVASIFSLTFVNTFFPTHHGF